MEVKQLKTIDAKTFNLAFSDYQVPFHFSERQLEWNLRKNSFDKTCSVGLYDKDELCGFILNGRRDDKAYDCGTAIIREYRGNGYAHLLVNEAISLLKEQGLAKWMLEVITNNTKALGLYQNHGFVIGRELACYRMDSSDLKRDPQVNLIPASKEILQLAPPCKSSWQNDNTSLIVGKVPLFAIRAGRSDVGYLALAVKSGSVMQLFIADERRGHGYGQGALRCVADLTHNASIKFINVDTAYKPMTGLLEKTGFSCFARQYEMQYLLNSAIV